MIRRATRALIPEPVRFSVLTAFGRYPSAYRFVAGTFGLRGDDLVDRHTDICIEAPPGSGNSFVVQAFSMANPKAYIAHHHHVSAQVLSALHFGIPVLTILRNPVDCVLARVMDPDKLSDISLTLRAWIAFWDVVEPKLDRIACSTFEDMVADPSRSIDLLNQTFGTNFNRTLPEAAEVFEVMHHKRSSSQEHRGKAGYHPNVPDSAKAVLKERVRPRVEEHSLTDRTLEKYRTLTARLHASN